MKAKILFTTVMMAVSSFHAYAGDVKTLYVDKAGTLISLLTEDEANNITHLVVTGKINAIDFRHLRDGFARLEVLDLSNATIRTYVGKEGTYPNNIDLYPANSIPAYAFCKVEDGVEKGKSSLKQIILSEKIKSIETAAFKNCDNLRICQIKKKTPPNLFEDAISDTVTAIFVPLGATGEYRYKQKWNSFAFIEGDPITVHVRVNGTESLESVIQKTGIQPKNINFLTIEGNLDPFDFRLIRDYMPNLVTLDITNTTTIAIPEFSFAQKNYLLRIELPKGLKSIGERAFSGCARLSSVLRLPATMTAIEYGAFMGCDKLKKVYVTGNQLTAIGENLFGEGSGKLIFD